MSPNHSPKLTFRYESEGGSVRARPLACPAHALTRGHHIVLLIHGFNNDEEEALEAYEGFRSLQRELGGLGLDQPVANGMLVDVYWPGDQGVFDYEDSIPLALKTAEHLALALQRAAQQSTSKAVDIVAHSMGCRLTLQLLSELARVPEIEVRRAVFMAAAVPTFMLEANQPLRLTLDLSALEGLLSLYSGDDSVLNIPFKAGQWDADGEPWTQGPEWMGWSDTIALGRHRWTYNDLPVALEQVEVHNAGHSDYWGWDEDTRDDEGRRANIKVKEFLGFTAAGPREVLGREVDARESAPERPLPEGRDLTERAADGSQGETCVEI